MTPEEIFKENKDLLEDLAEFLNEYDLAGIGLEQGETLVFYEESKGQETSEQD